MPTHIKEVPPKTWLQDWFYEKDGNLYWKARRISKGRWSERGDKKLSTTLDKAGYLRCVVHGVNYALSRLVYQWHHGDLTPEFEVDHENLDKTCNLKDNLRKVPQQVNKRNKPRQINAGSTVTGVCKNTKTNQCGTIEYWVARWYDSNGTLRGKHFRIDRLGSDEAFKQASAYRVRMMKELNQQGAGYTALHGQ